MPTNTSDHAYDVFISYSHADEEWVCGWLLPRLEAADLRVCIDFRDFDVGVPGLVNMERAVSASYVCTLKVWDLATGQEERTLAGHEDWVGAVAVTPDGRRAISASCDRTLKVWDLATGQEMATIALEGALPCVALAPDGVTIVTGDRAGNVYGLRYVERDS